MNYKNTITVRAFMKTATLHDLLIAEYEGEERRKEKLRRMEEQRRIGPRREEPRDDPDRRQKDRRDPLVRDIQAPDIVIHVNRKGTNTVYNSDLQVLATLNSEDMVEKQWDTIKALKDEGKIDKNAKIFTARIMPTSESQDLKDSTLFNVTDYYNLYISGKTRKDQ